MTLGNCDSRDGRGGRHELVPLDERRLPQRLHGQELAVRVGFERHEHDLRAVRRSARARGARSRRTLPKLPLPRTFFSLKSSTVRSRPPTLFLPPLMLTANSPSSALDSPFFFFLAESPKRNYEKSRA